MHANDLLINSENLTLN